jgi:hypothetical protein
VGARSDPDRAGVRPAHVPLRAPLEPLVAAVFSSSA